MVFQVPPTKITIDEERIENDVSIDRATLAPLPNFSERQLLYTQDEPVDIWDDRVDESKRQTIAGAFADAPGKYAADCIVHHVGEGYNGC